MTEKKCECKKLCNSGGSCSKNDQETLKILIGMIKKKASELEGLKSILSDLTSGVSGNTENIGSGRSEGQNEGQICKYFNIQSGNCNRYPRPGFNPTGIHPW